MITNVLPRFLWNTVYNVESREHLYSEKWKE